MSNLYARMSADAADYWNQSKDWINVILGLLDSPETPNPQSQEFADLRALCVELDQAATPTDEQVARLRSMSHLFNPNPTAEAVAAIGGPDFDRMMDTIVLQHNSRREALALRRAVLSYHYLSRILDGVQMRRRVAQSR